jgi:hypothetical protein
VLIINSLNEQVIEDYAQNTFQRLGIGKKKYDNGLLFLIVVSDRIMRIQTGYGVEEYLTDYQCKNILDYDVKPDFKNSKYYNGILNGVNSIKEVFGQTAFDVYKQNKEKEKIERNETIKSVLLTILDIILILSIISIIIYFYIKFKKLQKEFNDIKNKIKLFFAVEYIYNESIKSEYLKEAYDIFINYKSTISIHDINKLNITKKNYLKIKDIHDKLENLFNNYKFTLNNINNKLIEIDKYNFNYLNKYLDIINLYNTEYIKKSE